MASESVQRLKFGVLQGTNLNNPYGAQGYTRSKVEKAKTEKWKCLCICDRWARFNTNFFPSPCTLPLFFSFEIALNILKLFI